MKSCAVLTVMLTFGLGACGDAGKPPMSHKDDDNGGESGGGGSPGGGSGGSTPSGSGGNKGTAGTVGSAGIAGAGGGSSGGGGASGGSGGSGSPDASAAGSGGGGGGTLDGGSDGPGGGRADLGGPDGSSGSGDGGASAGGTTWYEAEKSAVTGRAVTKTCMACPSRDAMKPGDTCCSGGGMVAWIVSAGNGEIEFKDVNVPSAGNYDVTFWYFCGKKDNFGDTDCGKQTDPPTKNAGCRPHQFFVNATLLPGAYHFPCFDGPWNIVRAATVNFPLKAGVNTIKMHAPPPRDSVDMDAIQVFPLGSKGLPPLIGSRPDLLGH